MASKDSGEEWEAVHEVFADNDGDNIMIYDNLPGTKTTTPAPAPDVSQAHLDKLHEMVHVFTHGHGVDRVRRHDSR